MGTDVLISAALLVLQIGLSLLTERHGDAGTHVSPAGWIFLAVGPLALLGWRHHPVLVLWVTFMAALGPPAAAKFSYLSLVAAFFLAATTGHRRAAWTAIVTGYVAALWVMPHLWGQSPPPSDAPVIVGGWIVVVVVAADAVRLRKERAAERRRAQEIDDRRRAGEERLRTARDLHDVIGHNISLIHVQASVGLDLMDTRPDQARAALAAIKTVSKDALDELRVMLATLRQVGDEAPRSPVPGLDRLDELIELTRAAGLSITLETHGTVGLVPAAVDVTAYRIVQEALTNVTRHAPGAAVRVTVGHQPGAVVIEVVDSGRPHSKHSSVRAPGQGTGIGGMRDRAAALGGRVEVGPCVGGGFRVAAELPVTATP